jgi:hypothetical protein
MIPRNAGHIALAVAAAAGFSIQQAKLPQWRLVPEQRFGSLDGPDALTHVSGLLSDDKGRVYVAQMQESHIKVFDRSGKFLYTIGRNGSGPGEFKDVSSMQWIADTLVVPDYRQKRVNLFAADGKVITTWPLQNPGKFPGTPSHVTFLRTRLHAAVGGFPLSFAADGRVKTSAAVLLGKDEALVDTLYVRDLTRQYWTVTHCGNGYYVGGAAIDNDPWFLGVPNAGGLYVLIPGGEKKPGELVVRKYGENGKRQYERTLRLTPRPVTPHVRDSIINHLAAPHIKKCGGAASAVRSKYREVVPIAKYYPPIDSGMASADGSLWLREGGQSGATQRWRVLDATGKDIAMVTAPAGARLQHVNAQYVYAMQRDEFDVQSIVRYRVTK